MSTDFHCFSFSVVNEPDMELVVFCLCYLNVFS